MTDANGHGLPQSEGSGADDARVTWPEETIPILRVADAAVALRWYERLGFVEEWTHCFEPGFPAFMSIRRGSPGTGVRIFLSEHRGDAVPDGLLFLRVCDVAPIAAEFDVEIHDSGARHEVKLADPDGNRVRIGAPTGRTEPGYTFPAQRS
jgi:catechol 2,3-dioxygenase-like lactoylglutathione lyase family enzyme